ncbi:hypothetical protein KP509_25G036600 [Ceratopteris richardii]|nr:hypothetical protein KP509_25G036600 [Ceratopteris richardii]
MGDDSFLLNEFGFVALLKACTALGDLRYGVHLHCEFARKSFCQESVIIGTALIDMYAKCHMPIMAQEVFDMLPDQDVVSWTALIAGYAQHGYGKEAIRCFELMQKQGFTPNATTFSSVLKACASIGALDKGSQIHDEILGKGLIKTNQIVGNALVDMYAKCGKLDKAQEVFDALPVQDIVSLTTLITGYVKDERGRDALTCLAKMQELGIPADVFTSVACLNACGSILDAESGKKIHADVIKKGLVETNSILGAALIDMYAKCNMLDNAQNVFNKLPNHDINSWNALISAYVQCKCKEEILAFFDEMRLKGFTPDSITFVSVLNACGSIGTAKRGEKVHAEIEEKGLLQYNLLVGNALVDMYAKCGLLAEAQAVFDELQPLDVISWNSLIAGYAHFGDFVNVLHLLHCMKCEGIRPNSITLISALNVLIHEGLVAEGELFFSYMSEEFDIVPTLEHRTRMVGLFGCAGQLEKAVSVFDDASYPSDIVMSLMLLSACRKCGNLELAKQAFKQAVKLDEKDAAAYICMGDMYRDLGMLEEANKVEKMRVRKGAWKHREIFDGLIS